MNDNKPVVLSTVTFPDSTVIKRFFASVEEHGYKIQHFPISDQNGLLQAAFNASAENRPVAVICSQNMKSAPDVDLGPVFNALRESLSETYRGDKSGMGLAEALAQGCETPNLTIVYSSLVNDDFDALETDSPSQVIKINKMNWDRDRKDAEVACDAMDQFFAKHAPAVS